MGQGIMQMLLYTTGCLHSIKTPAQWVTSSLGCCATPDIYVAAVATLKPMLVPRMLAHANTIVQATPQF